MAISPYPARHFFTGLQAAQRQARRPSDATTSDRWSAGLLLRHETGAC